MRHSLPPISYSNRTGYTPIDLTPKWQSGVVTKVRTVHMAVLPGTQTFQSGEYVLPGATGILELTGHREGPLHTCLLVGFSDAEVLPAPQFFLDSTRAMGTLSLPTHRMGTFLQVAQQSGAHFRINDPGELNGLASDASMFQLLG